MLQLDLRTYTGTHLARQPLRGAHATHQRPLGRAPPPAALALAPVLRQGCGSAAIVAGHRLGWLRVARLLIAALLLRFPAALAAVLLRLRLWRRLRSAHHQEGGDGRVLPSVWLLWPKLSCWVARQVSPNLSGGNLVKSQQVSPLSWPCLGPAAVGRPLRLNGAVPFRVVRFLLEYAMHLRGWLPRAQAQDRSKQIGDAPNELRDE
jgi:hypothetical protein